MGRIQECIVVAEGVQDNKKRTGQTSAPRRTPAPSERPCTEKTGEEETIFYNISSIAAVPIVSVPFGLIPYRVFFVSFFASLRYKSYEINVFGVWYRG